MYLPAYAVYLQIQLYEVTVEVFHLSTVIVRGSESATLQKLIHKYCNRQSNSQCTSNPNYTSKYLSQSVPLLAILASSLTLTCLSLIKSTLCPNLVISTFETFVEFVIFFLFAAATARENSFVSSKLDYCNSLYSGISQSNLN